MKEKIKAFFKKHPQIRIKAKELSKKLGAEQLHEYAQLKSILHQLEKESFILKQGKRYSLWMEDNNSLEGKIEILNDGKFGFVTITNLKMEDIFIPERYLGPTFDGDTVKIELLPKKRGKNTEGKVIGIIKRKKETLTGTLKQLKGEFILVPDDNFIHKDFSISPSSLKGASHGDKVVIGNIRWDDPKLTPIAEIVEVFGKSGTYDAEIKAFARDNDIDYNFPKEVLDEAENISEVISEEEIKQRYDFRDSVCFTIDPEDAKDFDDAVSLEQDSEGNYILGVHIADVAHFVKTGSPIYNEALKRATSIYLVGRVIPMLPEKLSNNVCSLKPEVDRLAFSVFIKITPRGKILSYEFKKTIINSKKRFSYQEAQNILDEKKGNYFDILFKLNSLAKTLRNKRIRKGSINFHSPEVKFKLDEAGRPISIEIRKTIETNILIEEMMLLANKITAMEISKQKEIPFVYRIHDKPDQMKLSEFSAFVKTLGYNFDANSSNTAKQFQDLIDKSTGTSEESLINEIAIRSMAKAIYSGVNIGHYGLAFEHYTHFTSPIRRFPDLVVHKILFNYLAKKSLLFSSETIEKICEHSSEKEREAINAERISVKLKQIEYLRNKVGGKFLGIISGITTFGLFVQLIDNLAEGLVRYKDMDDDYYHFDEKNYCAIGERNKRKFRLGDKVTVFLEYINEEKRIIDFLLVD